VTGTSTVTESVEPAGPRPQRSSRRGLIEWVVIIVVALLAAVLIKTFLVQAYYIPSGSMEPTIMIGDRVLVDKVSYDLHGVHRGDIIVFSTPPDDTGVGGGVKDLIKRVIGLPGETLRSGPDSEIFIDGRLISQPWLTPGARSDPGPAICSVNNQTDCVGDTLHLPKGEYFVMGDNRGDSSDSRYFGPISGHLIVGRTFVRIWPLSRLHWF
jgi:signal peptidase I